VRECSPDLALYAGCSGIVKVIEFYVENVITLAIIKFQLILINSSVINCPLAYIRLNFDIDVCITWYVPKKIVERKADKKVYALHSALDPGSRFKVSVGRTCSMF